MNNQQSYYFDMILTSTVMSLISSQVSAILNKFLLLLIIVFKIILIFFQKVIILIFAGKESRPIVINDFNPIFTIIDKNVFEKNNKDIIWWSKCYGLINGLKEGIQNNDDNSKKDNKYENFVARNDNNKDNDMNVCTKKCPICANNPLFLEYDYNTYDVELKQKEFEKEHYGIIQLTNSVIIKFKDYKIMLEKYACKQYSNIIVLKVFSKNHNLDILSVLQDYLNTLGNYKDEIIYSVEISDKKKKKTRGWYDPEYIFNNVNTDVFSNLVENICRSDAESNDFCEEFRMYNNSNSLNVVGCKLNDLTSEEVKINEPLIITDFKVFIKLQKRLNVGYRNYYNRQSAFLNNEAWQVILTSIDNIIVTIILAYHRFGIIISKSGSVVTKEDMSNIVVKIMSHYNKFEKEVRPTVHKLIDANKCHWKKSTLSTRSLSTIYLPDSTKREITSIMDNFLENEESYLELGITYKLGILFYGPPGTGKTSLVKAIANDYGMPIYIMDLNNSSINDDSISNILNSLGETDRYKILLFEDVDSAFVDKEEIKNEVKTICNSFSEVTSKNNKNNNDNVSDNDNSTNDTSGDNKIGTEQETTKKSGVQVEEKFLSYSGLLNAFDGVTSNQNKVIMIMTTNYKEKLGNALVRPGRIDYCFCIDYCNYEQIVVMTNKILRVLNKNLDSDGDGDVDINYDSMINDFANKIMWMYDDLNKYNNIPIGVTPAKLQTYIMKYSKDINLLLNNYSELLQ